MELNYNNYLNELKNSLDNTEFTDMNNKTMNPSAGFGLWVELTKTCKLNNKSIYFIGNGASATMSSHMSADACKNGKLKSKCLNDIALVTAISNDIEYMKVFSVQLERYADEGDLLITISSSGNSPNVVTAIQTAREMKMKIVTLSGMKAENKSRKMGDLNIYIPNGKYGLVESGHQVILHCWLDMYLGSIGIFM